MASFLGEMATSVGGAFTEHAEGVREERLQGEDAQRDMQLTKMRMAHESGLTQKRIDADDVRATRRMDYDTMVQEQEFTFKSEEAVLEREAGEAKYTYEGQVDMVTAGLIAFAKQQSDGVAKGNGWTTFQQQSYDEDGRPVTAHFATREGITWRQIGDKYVQAGDPNKIPYDFDGNIENQRNAERALWAGEITAQEFDDTYDYVPAAFITGRVVSGNQKARKFLEGLGISVPRGAPGGDFELPSMVPSVSSDIQTLLDDSAAKFGVRSELLMSVMQIETGGIKDPSTAVSSAGAQGDMQIMPATFEEIGREIFGPDVELDINNPAHNIPVAAAYMSKMMQRFDGSIVHALAAYNAGPTTVDKAIKSGGRDWIDDLPTETRRYLPNALGRYYGMTQGGTGDGAISEGAAAAAEAAPAAEPVDEQIVEIPAEEQLPPAPKEEEEAAAPEGLTELPPRTEALRGTGLPAKQARTERRQMIGELTDDAVDTIISNIQSGMSQGGDIQMLYAERSKRRRERTILPHDLIFGTEKGKKFREENLARFAAEQEKRKDKTEETETQ